MQDREETVISILVSVLLSALSISSCAAASYDTPPEGFQLTGWQRSNRPPPLDVRRKLMNTVKPGELRLRPTFISCGVAWGAGREFADVRFEYRVRGASQWKRAPAPLWFRDTCDIRGSLLHLSEGTEYEMRVVAEGRVQATGRFRTWCSTVPIARTVVLDPAKVTYPIRIAEKGSPEGWIRYTSPPGSVLGGKDQMDRIIHVEGARYVLIENIEFRGGGGARNEPLRIEGSHAVRIANCEFSGWGRTGPQCFEAFPKGVYGGGKFLDVSQSTPSRPCLINYDAAMFVGKGASEIVIERCYAHDPRGRANSWLYSHPAGPEAVLVAYPDHSCVIRNCDFIGSDGHWFNDAVEGAGNFHANGGFNQDADVYGNFMIYCNDDCIELDGGQQNVRCFWNRFEAAVSGVSIQGCCASPVYVTDNLFSGMGEESGMANPSIKTATFDPWWYAPYAAVWRNIYQDSGEFCIRQGATSRWDIRDNVRDRNPSQAILAKFPVRPLPFTLDTGRIKAIAQGDGVSPRCSVVVARSTATTPTPVKIRQGLDADWFTVTPSETTIPPGGEVRFSVELDPAKMTGRRLWRSAFIVRTHEGLSRCVSVVGERVDFEMPAEPVPASDTTIYAKPQLEDGTYTFMFDVKKPGKFWFFARAEKGSGSWPKSEVSIDEGESQSCLLRFWNERRSWSLIRPGQRHRWDGITQHFNLEPGRHMLRVRPAAPGNLKLIGAAVTDTPTGFSPR